MFPGVDPGDYQAMLDAQRKQMLAQALTSRSLQGPQAPQPVSGGKYTYAPRMGLVTALSPLADAIAGKRAAQHANQGQAAIMSHMDEANAPTTDGSVNPRNPQNLPAHVVSQLQVTDPKAYAEYLRGTTEYQNALAAAHGDPQKARDIMLSKANKEASLETKQGGELRIPDNQGGYITYRTPNLPQGTDLIRDERGEPIGVRLLKDAPQAAASMQGAETAAKEANTPRLIPQGGGVEKLGYPGTPPALQPGGSAAPAPPPYLAANASTAPPAPRYFPQATTRLPVAAAPPGPPVQPGSMWQSVPKLNIPHTPGQSTDTYHQGILGEAVKKDGELVNTLGQNAHLADARLAFNREALGVLQGAETGPLSDTLTHLAAKAQELGLHLPWLPDSKTVQNTQELKKFLLRNPLLSLKPTFGGRPAASEFQVLANDASPSPSMLKSTISRLVQLDSTQAQYDKQKAADYMRYQSSGGDPRQFETWYAQHKPMGKEFLKADTPPAAIARLKQNPALGPAFSQQYGWAPGVDD